jgi:hypothetical protein
MPHSTKPIPVEQRNSQAASCGQRIQGYWWNADEARRADLRALWPEMARSDRGPRPSPQSARDRRLGGRASPIRHPRRLAVA